METPILDIVLRTPLPSALTRFLAAVAGSMPGMSPRCGQVLDGGHGQVRVDRGRAVADQQRDVVHLAGVAGLDDQPDPGAGALAHQVVVHGAGEQQRRDRRVVASTPRLDSTISRAPSSIASDTSASISLQPLAQPRAAVGGVERAAHGEGGEAGVLAVVVDVHDLGQVVVAEHRERQHDRAAVRRRRRPAGSAPGRAGCCREVTSSSRIASSGGLVTCANSWVK